MNNIHLINLIRESVYSLLEEFTEFSEGSEVITMEDGEGIVNLSKHPYYSIKLHNTGVTKSFHYNQLKPKEEDFGKYDINESEGDEIVHLDGILVCDTTIKPLGSLLSDIRSILGVTIVRNEDRFDNKEYLNTQYKSQLFIKIDPIQYKGKPSKTIQTYISQQIRKLDAVRSFNQNTPSIIQKDTEVVRNPIPQASPNINELKKKVKFKLNEIKINQPTQIYFDVNEEVAIRGREGFINFVEDYSDMMNGVDDFILDRYKKGIGLGEKLIGIIMDNHKALYKKYNLQFSDQYFKDWLLQYVDNIGLPLKSSGSFYTAFTDFDWVSDDNYFSEEFGIDHDELYNLFKTHKTF